ncbi:hypothetical protein AAKU52_002083 [Pedobacter sp. CG_S7]|uniref:hypothetical protein n=1 Tax=Pedobacter sp. CG_S7 TaxID=3143930 RepID=UPI0033934CC0
MKLLLLIFTFLMPLSANDVDKNAIIKIRDLLLKAADSRKANKDLKAVLANYSNSNTLINGYRGAAVMIEAKHMFNPLSRWNKFKQGKELIEDAIKKDGENYELRYLRFAIQTTIPAVLGYSENINTDKKMLINQLEGLNDTDLRKRVIIYLLAAKVCTTEELNKLKLWKNK